MNKEDTSTVWGVQKVFHNQRLDLDFCRKGAPRPKLHRFGSPIWFFLLLSDTTSNRDGDRLTAHDSRKGFSLIEMIVATTVLSLAIVGLLGLIQTSLSNAGRVRQYDRAAMRARSTMSELLVMDPLPVPGKLEGRYDQSSGWEAAITPFEFPRLARVGAVMVVQIRLTVWWDADGRRKTAVFDGLRRLQITPDHREALP